jgi:zinc transporter ZupT
MGTLTSLVAGAFIYIGVADLIPEAMRGRKWRNTLWMLLGVALMGLVLLFEGGHGH